MTFPLGTAPSYFTDCTFPNNRSGIFYSSPTVTLSQATPTGYTCYDAYGNTISTGAVTSTTVPIAAPTGGWKYGWYKVLFTGPNTDPTYGSSYGECSFIMVPLDSRFPQTPTTTSPDPGSGQGGGQANDIIMQGCLGFGPVRAQISDVTSGTGADSFGTCETSASLSDSYWTVPSTSSFYDSARPRKKWLQFPNRTYDRIDLGSGTFCRVYAKDATIDTTSVYIQCGPGTTGNLLQVYYPNSSTLVESYDNLTSGTVAESAINGVSNYIRVYHSGSSVVTAGPTAIGNTYFTGTANCVATLYPYGYTTFEGPINEGGGITGTSDENAHRMTLFAAAVHAGNASAKAAGPCNVDILTLSGSNSWDTFLTQAGSSLDVLSTHAYNFMTNGDLALGRSTMQAWRNLITTHGLENLEWWITESTNVFTSVYGVEHANRSRVILSTVLMLEQFGCPREQNIIWYSRSHGFNSYPSWANTGSGDVGSPVPYTALMFTLARETFGMPFSSALDFGTTVANNLFLGNFYQQPNGNGCVVLMQGSYMPSSSVTLKLSSSSTGNLTMVDPWGNTSTLTPSNGLVTVPVQEFPVYLRLPAGITPTVYHVNDWSPSQTDSISSQATTATVGGVSAPAIADGGYLSNYANQTGVFVSANNPPEDAILLFPSNITTDRVVVFGGCGGAWQNDSAPVSFTVDTTTNGGTTWTTQSTVSADTPSSFQWGGDSNGNGCGAITFWREQSRFDVSIPKQTINGVRVHVTATSYGGEPDTTAIAAGGQGASAQHVALQEIAVLPAVSTYTYQWQDSPDGSTSWTNITGQTSSSYTVTSGESTKYIRCQVTATDDGGSNTASSNVIGPIGTAPVGGSQDLGALLATNII